MLIAVILPTYNEAGNIEIMIDRILVTNLPIHIIVVDDGSPDGTGEIVTKLAKKYKKKITLIERNKKMGLGNAYKAGFIRATKMKADYILTMDADLSHEPKVIKKMIDAIKSREVDIVVGSRYINGGKIIGFNTWRHLLSGSGQFAARFVLGISLHDATSGFRLYSRAAINGMKYEEITSEGYSFLVEAAYKLHKSEFSFYEVPITFRIRRIGKSKISHHEIRKGIITILKLKFKG